MALETKSLGGAECDNKTIATVALPCINAPGTLAIFDPVAYHRVIPTLGQAHGDLC